MPVGLIEPTNLLPVSGVELAVAASEMRYKSRDDLLVLLLSEGTNTAAVFTQNRFCAAPVTIAKQHLALSSPRALVVNAGNANAGTGNEGLKNTRLSCELVANGLGLSANQVLPFSTGVIGLQMAMSAYQAGVDMALDAMGGADWSRAAKAIMTTDTIAKAKSVTVNLSGVNITLTGIAKGSGMICPNMATMLAYIATDAAIEADVLQVMLSQAADASFNRITIDGDTSTNDALTLSATGQAGNALINDITSDDAELFYHALLELVSFLSQAIVRDGEGATKFVEIGVKGGTAQDCESIAYTVAHSPLVKTALFASDPNWGRILMAVGRAPVLTLAIDKVDIEVNGVLIIKAGEPAKTYTEEQGKAAFSQDDINMCIRIGESTEECVVWTSDLSHDYVSINADYRS